MGSLLLTSQSATTFLRRVQGKFLFYDDNESVHGITCVHSLDSDQPGHSLIWSRLCYWHTVKIMCKLAPKGLAAQLSPPKWVAAQLSLLWCKRALSSLLKQIETNISPMKNFNL